MAYMTLQTLLCSEQQPRRFMGSAWVLDFPRVIQGDNTTGQLLHETSAFSGGTEGQAERKQEHPGLESTRQNGRRHLQHTLKAMLVVLLEFYTAILHFSVLLYAGHGLLGSGGV